MAGHMGRGVIEEQVWRKGPWTAEEDRLLVEYVRLHGEGRWNSVARLAKHEQCYEMAKMMLKVTFVSETILNTVNPKDQIYSEVSRSFAVRWKDVLDRLRNLFDKDGNLHIALYN
ncbi:transcription factor MYB2-like [Glycine soja]|uniref:transcription factor MYB2-like n=1 Tax=Glycine soja TaxID=3848 RepID=UPI00103DDE78|nr:transcription factor MYB2-like [Glycine soja]